MGDGAGLVQQQHVHVTGGLDGAARGGNHIGLHHAAHARYAHGRQQAADGGGDQADQQGHQGSDADRAAGLCRPHAEQRERQQRDGDHQKHDGESHQQNGQRNFIGRLLALGAFDHADHAVQKRLAGVHGDAHHQPVRQHPGATGDGGKVATGLAHHRCRFAGDGALIHRSHTLNHLAVHGDHLAGFHKHHITLAQILGLFRDPVVGGQAGLCIQRPCHCHAVRFGQLFGPGALLEAPQRCGLCLAAALGQGLGKVGKQHGEPQPDGNRQDEPGRSLAQALQGLHAQQGGQNAADVDDKHHRVAPLYGRTQFAERSLDGRTDQGRVHQGQRSMGFHVVFLNPWERRRLMRGPEHQVFHHRAQCQGRHVVE